MNLFLKKFQGQYMEFVINMTMNEEFADPQSGEPMTRIGPLVIQAFVVDVDDNFVYLGNNPLEIDSAVKIEDIRYVSIVEPVGFEDSISDPERDESLN